MEDPHRVGSTPEASDTAALEALLVGEGGGNWGVPSRSQSRFEVGFHDIAPLCRSRVLFIVGYARNNGRNQRTRRIESNQLSLAGCGGK